MANKRNYQKELDAKIAGLHGEVPTLLLHSCCAPCSSYVLEYLSQYFSITLFYYNPNIYPPTEYEHRVEEQQRLIHSLPAVHPISFCPGPYDSDRFYELTRERKEKVGEMMETYGLKSFSNARPSELSGGMRQRAALIRTLAMEPDLLLLDEPFSALDYQTRLNVCDDIGKIIKKEGKTAILVTHDISEAISMADRVIVLAARPAYVKKKIPIRFAMEERTPMKARSAPEFKTYFNAIWKELNENA